MANLFNIKLFDTWWLHATIEKSGELLFYNHDTDIIHVMNSWEKTGDMIHWSVNNKGRNRHVVVMLYQITSIL